MEHLPVHLVLDVGNSRTKVALYQGVGNALRWTTLANGDHIGLDHWLHGLVPDHAVHGSVASHHPELDRFLTGLCPILEVSGTTPTPLRSAYATPHSLGADRLANAVGAVGRFPGRPVLAVDAGTCITYDLVSAEGIHLGGAITPGMHLRAKAMNNYSARLPLVDPGPSPAVLGSDTHSSLSAGIHHGILNEVMGFITTYGHHRADLAVVLTGGDALRIATGLKSGIFAHPLLTLEGFHAILLYNLAHHSAPGGPLALGIPGPGSTG
ncbi:MAG: type III pantothenate kinase [Flavobacteriales bacterium]